MRRRVATKSTNVTEAMTKPIKPKPKKSGYEARNKRMHDFGWKPS
jgi:hypothetical protein